MRVVPVLALVLASFAGACGSSSTAKPVAPAVAPIEAPAPPTAARAMFPGLPDTLAGEHLAWILDAIVNRDGVVATAEVERRLHAEFLAAVPAEQFVDTSKSLTALAPFEVKSVEGTELALVAKVQSGKGPLIASVEVDPTTKQMVSLLFKPDVARPSSFAEAVEMTERLAPQAQLLVARLDGGACKPMHATTSTQPLAVGSTFKLYVLLALVDQIVAGKARWDDELAVRDAWKSPLSDGTVNDPEGTKLTLRTYAERMISISDNSATDHLLYTVGRKQVEAAMRTTKHATPKLNMPLFSTREMSLFKLGMPDAEIDRYRKLSEAKRRAYLDKTLAGKAPDLAHTASWTAGRRIDQIEWFASADDLCRAMATLWQRAQQDAARPLLDVLALKPGIGLDAATWPYVGFKGGGEPGVLNLTWLARRADGQWFVVVLTANAPDATVEYANLRGVAEGVFELLAKP